MSAFCLLRRTGQTPGLYPDTFFGRKAFICLLILPDSLQIPNHLADSHYMRSLQLHTCTVVSPASSVRRAHLHTPNPLLVSLQLYQPQAEHLSLNCTSRMTLVQHTNTDSNSRLTRSTASGVAQKKNKPSSMCRKSSRQFLKGVRGQKFSRDYQLANPCVLLASLFDRKIWD